MLVFEWMEKTHPNRKGLSRAQKAELVKLRTRVCNKAKTNIHILINAKCRGSIGKDLITRLSKATAKEDLKILVESHFPD